MTWVSGWAVPETWLAAQARAAWPGVEHVCVSAGPDVWARLEALGRSDVLAGYSLGTSVLLADPERAAKWGDKIGLVAPVLAFCREDDRGGRVARTQVRVLARWLRRDRAAAVEDFYARAGLVEMGETGALNERELTWGLERLEKERLEPRLPAGWSAWVGSDDALLDAAVIKARVPAVRVVAGATHHPAALMRAWAEDER